MVWLWIGWRETRPCWSTVVAASVSAGGLSASGGGVGVYNTIDNTVKATIIGSLTVTAGGAVRVHAHEDAEVNADATVTSVAGSVGGALGVAILNNTVASTITATVDQATIDSVSTAITGSGVLGGAAIAYQFSAW